MNLSSLSSQLNLSIQELRQKASAKGFAIGYRVTKIDNALAKQILDAIQADQRSAKPKVQAPVQRDPITLPAFIQVRDFATQLNLPVTEVIRTLIKNGVMATINEEIDFETATIIAQDLGFEVETKKQTQAHEYGLGFLQEMLAAEPEESLKLRPPIVAVMGHVDHGKTTLLDAIRQTNVVAGESGGITQHIGAYRVKHNGHPITFLDTPGHEAFVEMRARGANVTDLIVLVVAADDSVRPQTIEVINRAKFTNTPIVVAINKVDKESANVLRVKQELAEHGVLTEEWGGKTIAVEVSAKQRLGIDNLLEMILLQAEVENFRANPDGKVLGTIIESRIAQGKGVVVSIIVQNGTLKVGDIIVAGTGYGRVRSLEDETGRKLKQAGPSTPALVAGFSEAPAAGDILQLAETIEQARDIAQIAQKQKRSRRLQTQTTLYGDIANKALNLILKTDVAGSLEAVKQSLAKMKSDEVTIKIVADSVGEVNENDIMLADSAKATILAFRVKTNPKALNLAKQKKVAIQNYDVIYELLESVTSAVVKMFTPEYEKVSFGHGKILAIFRTEKDSIILGGRVDEGELRKSKPVMIYRDGAELGRAEITELQQNKIATKEVSHGHEFGMKLKTTLKLKVGDKIESFEENLKQKSLIV